MRSLQGISLLAGLCILFTTPAFGGLLDDFEDYPAAVFPAAVWSDAAAVSPVPLSTPSPSVEVVSTAGPSGSTQALSLVDYSAACQGIYRYVGVQSTYHVRANIRVDQFASASYTGSHWAMQVGVGKLTSMNLAWSPNAAIYADAFTQGWRVYVYGTGSPAVYVDIDLGVPAVVGTWYTVEMTLETTNGTVRSRIWDASTGALLVDQFDAIPGWTASQGLFDVIDFFDGETTSGAQNNLAVIDEIYWGLDLVPVEPTTWGGMKSRFIER
jgi:hypothetical protein